MNKPVNTTLAQIIEQHDKTQKVRILYNGEKFFFGVVGAIAKYVDEYYINKPANVYQWSMNDYIEVYIGR